MLPSNEIFRAIFGREPDATASAPGRVNLIGEHTDYNGGYVLPSTLPHETTAWLSRRGDRRVRVCSVNLGTSSLTEFVLGAEQRQRSWADYLQGVTWSLRQEGLLISGFDLLVASTVPLGKGLSSSASLEVAALRAIAVAFDLDLSAIHVAQIAHRAETGFVGAPVGIMDQMVCSLGDRGSALFLDAAVLRFEKILLPPELELAVIDSGISHTHAGGEYRTRRQECDEAARRLGVRWLRDVAVDDLERIQQLPEPLNRRARHVVTENARVLSAVDALRQHDMRTLGELFLASHQSMRNDFEVSLPSIDRLVAIATGQPGAYGARLTGGGFGGAVVIACRQHASRAVSDRTLEIYNSEQGHGEVLLPAAR